MAPWTLYSEWYLVVSALFVFIEVNEGSAKAFFLLSSFLFFSFSHFLFVCSLISLSHTGLIMPYYALLCQYFFLFFVLSLSVKQQLYTCTSKYLIHSCCFARATGICSCSHVCVVHVVLLAAFPFLSSCIIFLRTPTCRVVWFALFYLFYIIFVPLFLRSGLFCCVLVPGTLAFHSRYLAWWIATVWLTLFHS